MEQKILVTGVTGTVGSEVIKALLKKGIKVRAGVRSLAKIENTPWKNQVEVVVFDYEQPEVLKNALKNITKLFFVSPPGSYTEKEIAESVLEQSRKQGLKYIVRLSGMGADKHNLFANHQAADNLLLSSKIDYTSLQPNTFMQNFYNYQTAIKEQDKIIEPAHIIQMKKDIDEPLTIINECIKGRKKLLTGFGGHSRLNKERYKEAQEPTHFAISLIGEPTLYPKIGEMIALLRKQGKTSFIDARDIAEVAATILTETGHENKIYELTGGESLDYYQAAKLFSDVLGRTINYKPLSEQEYIKAKEAEGIPAEYSKKFMKFYKMVESDEYAHISPIVEKILGRKPITLKQFIIDYRDKFI